VAALVGIGLGIAGLLFVAAPIERGWLRHGWVRALVSAITLSVVWTVGLYTT